MTILDTFIEDPVKAYLNEISKYDRLSKEENISLCIQAQNGDKNARTRLINSNLRLVAYHASKFISLNAPYLDLIQEGNIGLIKSVDKYDPKRKTAFSTCASLWITQELMRSIPKECLFVKIPYNIWIDTRKMNRISGDYFQKIGEDISDNKLAREMGKSPEDIIQIRNAYNMTIARSLNWISDVNTFDEETKYDELIDSIVDLTYSTEDEVELRFKREHVLDLVSTLEPRREKIITELFGLHEKPKVLEDLANEQSITRSYVSLLKIDSLKLLRPYANKLELQHFLS